MTVPASSTNRVQYVGNGVTDTFSTGSSLIFYDNTDLVVTETVIATGVSTVLSLTADYTVSGGDGSSGSVTLVAGALPATKRLTIERLIPYSQTTDLVEGEAILVDELETAIDRTVVMCQQINDALNRSVKLPSTTTAPGIALPDYVLGRLLSWSSSSADTLVNTSFTASDVQGAIDGVVALSAGSGVLVSSNDAAVGFLNGKLVAGTNITLTEGNDGGNETLTIASQQGQNELNAINLFLYQSYT